MLTTNTKIVILRYWSLTVLLWAVFGYLLYTHGGDNFHESSEYGFAPFFIIMWIIGSGILMNPLYLLADRGKGKNYLEKEPVTSSILPIIFITVMLISNPLHMMVLSMVLGALHIFLRFVILFETFFRGNTGPEMQRQKVFGTILLVQSGLTLIPFTRGSHHHYVIYISLIMAILTFATLLTCLLRTGSRNRAYYLTFTGMMSAPVLLAISEPHAWKEWTACFLICSAYYLLFYRTDSNRSSVGPANRWASLLPLIISVAISLRHLPLLILSIFFLFLPDRLKSWKSSSWWVSVTTITLTFPVWILFGYISHTEALTFLPGLSRYFGSGYASLFGGTGMFILAPVWLLGLYGICFSSRSRGFLFKLAFLGLLYSGGCYAAVKYPVSLPFMYFLPFVVITGIFSGFSEKHRSYFFTVFESAALMTTFFFSAFFAVARIVSLTGPGMFYFNLRKPGYMYQLLKGLLYDDQGLKFTSAVTGIIAGGVIILLVLHNYFRRDIPVSQDSRINYPLFSRRTVHIPAVVFTGVLIIFFFPSANSHNILDVPFVLTPETPCRSVNMPAATESRHIAVISYTSNSVLCQQNMTAATMRLELHNKVILSVPFRTGIETAEWAAERPDVKNMMKHSPARIWDQTPELQDHRFYPRNRYIYEDTFETPLLFDKIIFCIDSTAAGKHHLDMNIEAVQVW